MVSSDTERALNPFTTQLNYNTSHKSLTSDSCHPFCAVVTSICWNRSWGSIHWYMMNHCSNHSVELLWANILKCNNYLYYTYVKAQINSYRPRRRGSQEPFLWTAGCWETLVTPPGQSWYCGRCLNTVWSADRSPAHLNPWSSCRNNQTVHSSWANYSQHDTQIPPFTYLIMNDSSVLYNQYINLLRNLCTWPQSFLVMHYIYLKMNVTMFCTFHLCLCLLQLLVHNVL